MASARSGQGSSSLLEFSQQCFVLDALLILHGHVSGHSAHQRRPSPTHHGDRKLALVSGQAVSGRWFLSLWEQGVPGSNPGAPT